jgi:DNA polymerase-4
MRRFTPLVEPVSIDEAFLDVTASAALFGSGRDIGAAIKRAIVEETQLTASVGVAPSKLVAKIASDLRKPDGLVVVEPGEEPAFLAPLPISRLWGVGERTAAVLRQYGIVTLGDLQRTPEDLLVRGMGPHAATLRARALGVDDAPVSDGAAAKSVSHEHTFDVDTRDPEVIEKTLLAMADGVATRLRKAGLMAGTVHVKVRDSRFNTITRQKSLPEPTDLTEPIWHAALELARPEVRGKLIRLLGVGTSNFDRPSQIGLFAEEDERRRRAIVASDRLRKRFGDRIVVRARLLDRSLPAPFERDVMRPVDRGTLESMGREEEGREPVELVPVDEDVRFTEGDDRI